MSTAMAAQPSADAVKSFLIVDVAQAHRHGIASFDYVRSEDILAAADTAAQIVTHLQRTGGRYMLWYMLYGKHAVLDVAEFLVHHTSGRRFDAQCAGPIGIP